LPAQKGLIHEISGILYSFELNIVENEEFVDHENSYFFMRSEVTGKLVRENVLRKLYSKLPQEANIQLHEKKKKDIVILPPKNIIVLEIYWLGIILGSCTPTSKQ